MALDVGTLVGYLKLDVSDVGKNVRKAQDEVRRGLGDLDKDADKAGTKVGGTFSASLSKGLKTAGAVLGGLFVVDKVVAWFRGAISAASDANETINKSTVIFGENQAAMEAWAKGAVRNLGMTQTGALDAASGFGDMFSQIGFADDKAAAMSRTVVQMAADFGSFNNLGTEDVLERIAAGFRGEYDSLQKLIPNISAARVEQEALAMTGKKSAAQLTAQEKAAATLAIVQKDGARAMGDFARTSNDTAGTQKQAAAAAQELAIKVGNMLLPAYTALVRFGRDQVIPFLSGTVDAIAPIVSGVGAMVSGFRDLPGPIQGAVIGLLAFILLKDRLAAVGTTIKTDVASALDTVRLKAMYAGDAATAAGGGFRGMASALGASAGAGLRGAASGLLGVLGGPWGAAFTGATALVGLWMQKQAESKRHVEELTESLDAQTGAVTRNTRERVRAELEKSGALKSAQQMGLSLQEVTDAALNNADAWNRVQSAMQGWAHTQQAAGAKEAEVLGPVNNVTTSVLGQAEAVGASAEAWMRKQAAMGTAGDAARSTSGEITATGNAASGAASKIETLADKLDRLSGDTLDAREASRRYEQAVDDLADALKEADKGHVKTADRMNTSTEAGRRLQSALDNVADSTMKSAKADLTRGDSLDVVTKRVEDARKGFIASAIQMGYDEKSAKALADQLGLTTTNVQALSSQISKVPPVKLSINQEIFNTAMAEVRAQLNSLSGVATVTARLQSGQLKQELRQIQNGINPNLQANGSIMQFAGGGFRGAGIYSDGADIVRFAERGTGGEAYIPLASSKRARSSKILAETNRLMGDPLGVSDSGVAGMPGAMVISGTLEIGGDGLARIVDGRITAADRSLVSTAQAGRRSYP